MGKFSQLTRLILVLITLFVAISLCWAQTQGNGNANGGSNSNGQTNGLSAPAGCQPGQMRCMKNKQRWAAAVRHADRRAADVRKHHGEVKR